MTPRTDPAASAERAARRRRRRLGALAIGLLAIFAIVDIWLRRDNWRFEDVRSYWDAALRLRDGLPLYGGTGDPNSYQVFRYAPWFAYAWVPLTYLPRLLAEWVWGATLGASAIAVLVALVRLRTAAAVALAVLLLPMFHSLVQVGNVQPLLIAALAFGVSRRGGPLIIAAAASLKATPILYVFVYVARRQWTHVAVAVLATGVLVAPMLLTDLGLYKTDPGASFSLYYYVSPLAWAAAAGASVLLAAWLAWRRSEWVWVATSVAVALVAPRAHPTYATFLVVGLLTGARDRIASRTLNGASRGAPPGGTSVRESS